MKCKQRTSFRPVVMVTLCVRVWIEISLAYVMVILLPVTLCVRVWIEINNR